MNLSTLFKLIKNHGISWTWKFSWTGYKNLLKPTKLVEKDNTMEEKIPELETPEILAARKEAIDAFENHDSAYVDKAKKFGKLEEDALKGNKK